MIALEGARLREAHQAWAIAQFSKFAYHQPNDMPPEPGLGRPPPGHGRAEVIEARAIMAALAHRKDP